MRTRDSVTDGGTPAGDQLLRSKDIRLTSVTEADLPTLTRWHESGEFLRLMDASIAYPKPKTQLTEWLADYEKSKTGFLFAIRPAEATSTADGGAAGAGDTAAAGGEILGWIEISEILWNCGTAWLGLALGPDHWDMGLGSQAVRLAVNYAFSELNLRRLQLTVFDYNHRAIAVYERAGFKREGSFREFLHRDGMIYDMHLYGLLRREWKEACTPQP